MTTKFTKATKWINWFIFCRVLSFKIEISLSKMAQGYFLLMI